MGELLTLGSLAQLIRERQNCQKVETWQIRRLFKNGYCTAVVRWVGRCRAVDVDDVEVVEAAMREAGYLPTRK